MIICSFFYNYFELFPDCFELFYTNCFWLFQCSDYFCEDVTMWLSLQIFIANKQPFAMANRPKVWFSSYFPRTPGRTSSASVSSVGLEHWNSYFTFLNFCIFNWPRRIQTPFLLFRGFRADKITFTTRWPGCRVQNWGQVWVPAGHLAITLEGYSRARFWKCRTLVSE